MLAALRAIADNRKRRINNVLVQQVAPKNGKCVYARVSREVLDRGVDLAEISFDPAVLYRVLLESMARLTRRGLLFNGDGGDINTRTFWVTMR